MARARPQKGKRKTWLKITQKRRQVRAISATSEKSAQPEAPAVWLRLLVEEHARLEAELMAVDAALAAIDRVPDVAGKGPGRQRNALLDIPKKPVVPVSRSVKPDYIVCLIDGERRKMLHRHLLARYGISPDEYRRHFRLPADYPMTAPGYQKQKSAEAIQQGFGRWDRTNVKARKEADA